MSKKLFYRIGEACKLLEIQPYVLRYWETEFPFLSPTKSKSGQRVYNQRELEVIRRIKELLYEEGYTIAGAKKKLEAEIAETSSGGKGDDDQAADKSPADTKAPVKSVKKGPEAAATRPAEKKGAAGATRAAPKKTAAEAAAPPAKAEPPEKAEPSAADTHPPQKTSAKKAPTRKTSTRKTSASRRKTQKAEAGKTGTQATAAPAADLDKASREQVEQLRSGVEAALSQTRSILELLAN